MSIKSRTNEFAGLFGFWQGSLPARAHQITVQHKGSNNGALYNGDPYTIAMDIVYCYWHVELISYSQHPCYVLYSKF